MAESHRTHKIHLKNTLSTREMNLVSDVCLRRCVSILTLV